ncbi:MAG: orotidine-5'-phosphate decarboxylase [Bacteroidota bacterium]|nr:orotidine-5'-phosphate decarboxylase [Bacteroidota bacterium]
MNFAEIKQQIEEKQTFLCIGLDPDMDKIPKHLHKKEDPIFEFCKQIVDSTHELAIAFKANTAFFEAYGHKGWLSLEKIANYIKKKYPQIFLIADAKRGDIFHSSKMYAKAFFETMPFDAITINPLLGKDVVDPFLNYKDKWIILLGLSSNPSAYDLQLIQELETREYIFEKIFKYGKWWGTENNIMYVVGATMAYKLQQIRHLVPDNFLLIPGIGAQGGDLEEVCRFGMTDNYSLIINSSRAIIYADDTENFAEVAKQKALDFKNELVVILEKYKKKKHRRKRF